MEDTKATGFDEEEINFSMEDIKTNTKDTEFDLN